MQMDTVLLVLTGMKHCGKTTAGSRLAEEWGLPFYDLDRIIIEIYREKSGKPYPGTTIREVYRKVGQKAFRLFETAGAERIISEAKGKKAVQRSSRFCAICALGGGTIENREAMDRLTGAGTFCYIREKEEVLYKRIITRGLPAFLSAGDPEGDFSRLYLRRTRLYEQQADITIDAMGRGAEELYAILKEQL
jgi:shikimate kinase